MSSKLLHGTVSLHLGALRDTHAQTHTDYIQADGLTEVQTDTHEDRHMDIQTHAQMD